MNNFCTFITVIAKLIVLATWIKKFSKNKKMCMLYKHGLVGVMLGFDENYKVQVQLYYQVSSFDLSVILQAIFFPRDDDLVFMEITIFQKKFNMTDLFQS